MYRWVSFEGKSLHKISYKMNSSNLNILGICIFPNFSSYNYLIRVVRVIRVPYLKTPFEVRNPNNETIRGWQPFYSESTGPIKHCSTPLGHHKTSYKLFLRQRLVLGYSTHHKKRMKLLIKQENAVADCFDSKTRFAY